MNNIEVRVLELIKGYIKDIFMYEHEQGTAVALSSANYKLHLCNHTVITLNTRLITVIRESENIVKELEKMCVDETSDTCKQFLEELINEHYSYQLDKDYGEKPFIRKINSVISTMRGIKNRSKLFRRKQYNLSRLPWESKF